MRLIYPKEKLVLVSVQDQAVLVGVSPAGMSKLTDLDHVPESAPETSDSGSRFSKTLGQVIKNKSVPPGSVFGDKERDI